MKFSTRSVTLALAAVGMAGAMSTAQAQDITGAGATFINPIMSKWAAEYNRQTNVKINYQSIGSGGGLRQIDGKTVDFASTDAPRTDADLTRLAQMQFPIAMGGVVPVINIRGINPGQMRMNGQVLGDIYLGKITKWNDPALRALNPNLALPDATIAPVRRADGSGTTFLFTNYLSKVNAEWKSKVGEGTAVNWPTGAGGKGNEGVAAFVGRLPNSIGYVEYSYVKQNKMNFVLMQNANGNFVTPDDTAFKAAAAGAAWDRSFFQILTNQPGAASWPITGANFIVMYLKQDKPANAAQALKFFDWVLTNGDAAATELDYVPMPAEAKTVIRAAWGKITDPAGKAIAFR